MMNGVGKLATQISPHIVFFPSPLKNSGKLLNEKGNLDS